MSTNAKRRAPRELQIAPGGISRRGFMSGLVAAGAAVPAAGAAVPVGARMHAASQPELPSVSLPQDSLDAWIDDFVVTWHRREMRGCKQWADAMARGARAQSLRQHLDDFCSGGQSFPQGEHVITWNGGRSSFVVDFDIPPGERRTDLSFAEGPASPHSAEARG